MNILVACEESQVVCSAFRALGHNAYSCDIEDCSGGHPEWHIKCDVLSVLNPKWYDLNRDGEGNQWEGLKFSTSDGRYHQFEGEWDMIIAHPPCTYLTNTGNPYFNVSKYGDKALQRFKLREEAFSFFKVIASANCDRIAIENPVGYCNTHYMPPTQIIEPWQFGHPFTKKTCLWLKGLPPLIPFVSVRPSSVRSYAYDTFYTPDGRCIPWNSKECKRLRSRTFEGVAFAMASQWG